MDSGVENLNKDVDKLLEDGELERVIAQIDVTFSNPLIESCCVHRSTSGYS